VEETKMSDALIPLQVLGVVVVGTVGYFFIWKPISNVLVKPITYIILFALCCAFWPLLLILVLVALAKLGKATAPASPLPTDL
jgi:hypothetical protein